MWKAWAEPERMAPWAGPRGFTLTSCEIGTHPGDAFRMSMRSPEGTELRVRGVYHEIVEGERLVYTWAWVDERGVAGHETVIKVTFADVGEKTGGSRCTNRSSSRSRLAMAITLDGTAAWIALPNTWQPSAETSY